jgi:putative transposase
MRDPRALHQPAETPVSGAAVAVLCRRGPGTFARFGHHSDQGVQYTSGDYRGLLQKRGMFPSVSRPGTPLDNASCESFMRTLKREEIQVGVFQSLEDLRRNIETFIERYYNGQRLHSALGYQPPDEYESSANSGGAALLSKGAILNI